MDVVIVGAGIGGLTLGAAAACRPAFPAASMRRRREIKPLGVGINLLPHASKELTELGLQDALAKVAITTSKIAYYNRFGQLIYNDPCGLLRRLRLAAVLDPSRRSADGAARGLRRARRRRPRRHQPPLHRRRAGRAVGATAHFEDPATRETLPSQRGSVVVSCEGIHSVIRKQFFPDEGPPRYSGINMWRGVTRWKPFLDGATMVRVGWHKPAKVLIYPIRDNIDARGPPAHQLGLRHRAGAPDPAARLEPAGQARGFHRRDRGLALRLARRAGDVPRRRPDPGISDGRPGSAAALVARPRHAARRRRASDAAARRQRRRAGDPRLHARSPIASRASPIRWRR